MERTEHCKIVSYGSDTVCHKCNRVWDTGYDEEIVCPYLMPPKKPQEDNRFLFLVLCASVAGIAIALTVLIRTLG